MFDEESRERLYDKCQLNAGSEIQFLIGLKCTYHPDMGFDVPRVHLNEWITTTKWGSPLWLAIKG